MHPPATLLLALPCAVAVTALTACSVRTRTHAGPADALPQAGDVLRVTTFNIRFGTADDGPNHWNLRRQAVLDAIRAFDPDLLGTQETLAFQKDFLLENLPHYAVIAAGRDDGRAAGEMTALFYRRDRFELLDSGHFWLSPTPESVASVGWDAAITRMATWARLRDRRAPTTTAPLLVINTHFDHVGQRAREESARLIRHRAEVLGQGCSIIVMGDFNAGEGAPPYEALVAPTPDRRALRDAYRAIHPRRQPDEGTFTAFDPARVNGDRIDWILVDERLTPVSAEIDRATRAGRIPSDHFPVHVVVRQTAPPG